MRANSQLIEFAIGQAVSSQQTSYGTLREALIATVLDAPVLAYLARLWMYARPGTPAFLLAAPDRQAVWPVPAFRSLFEAANREKKSSSMLSRTVGSRAGRAATKALRGPRRVRRRDIDGVVRFEEDYS